MFIYVYIYNTHLSIFTFALIRKLNKTYFLFHFFALMENERLERTYLGLEDPISIYVKMYGDNMVERQCSVLTY